jgi:hypothetical protein
MAETNGAHELPTVSPNGGQAIDGILGLAGRCGAAVEALFSGEHPEAKEFHAGP